jgi:hypothetical protein
LPPKAAKVETFEIPLHVIQDDRQSDDLPFGSRGGLAIRYAFPVDGEYLIKVRLQRQYQDYIKGMGWPQRLDVRLDSRLLKQFTVGGGAQGRPPRPAMPAMASPGLPATTRGKSTCRLAAMRGWRSPSRYRRPHIVGVSFVRELWEPEGLPQPLQRGPRHHRRPGVHGLRERRLGPDRRTVRAVRTRPRTRRAAAPSSSASQADRDGRASLRDEDSFETARLAYRRPVTNGDVQTLLGFFDERPARRRQLRRGIQFALERMLVDPDFLLRVIGPNDSRRPRHRAGVAACPFFLWSSIPDDRLLALAERGS